MLGIHRLTPSLSEGPVGQEGVDPAMGEASERGQSVLLCVQLGAFI